MAKMIQGPNVSDRLHQERPPAEEVFATIRSREPIQLTISAAEVIRKERRRRDKR